MKIPLDKILTCSARDYIESIGKKLEDYEMEGIHLLQRLQSSKSLIDVIDPLKGVPINIEVVTDCNFNILDTFYNCIVSGTALIPKDKPKK